MPPPPPLSGWVGAGWGERKGDGLRGLCRAVAWRDHGTAWLWRQFLSDTRCAKEGKGQIE
eukprot:1350578-Pleurochrysis_carterae.AAC.4